MDIQVMPFDGSETDAIRKVLRRSETDIEEIRPAVEAIIARVRADGDQALKEFTQKFDGVDLAGGSIKASADELDAAAEGLSSEVKAAIDECAANIRAFHEAQMPESIWFKEIAPGVLAGEKVTPIDSIALYVPRGKGSFPSVMLMLGVPASVAEVPRAIVCTPPTPEGGVDAATAYAARLAGLDEVYKVGGAQAIAAVAIGTETVPRVAKVMGPSNPWGTAAKRLLSNEIDPGVPAGPSESIILADAAADPEIVARDLLIEAEHGPDSAALLVTDSQALAHAVSALLPALVAALPEPRRGFVTNVLGQYGGIILCDSFENAIAFTNLFAPEHLECLTAEPFETLQKIRNAGEVLLGPWAPITVGNFSLGVNAILPTGGRAKTASCLTVHDYLKRTSIGAISQEGYARLAGPALTLADYEGFPAHAAALRFRGVPGASD